ncbi:MAG: hypothetical protein Q8N62_02020 [Candidatus Omnitrophota bacterium]|nr:hypothetical protein [Candidatus Omnitrophota bacterium]
MPQWLYEQLSQTVDHPQLDFAFQGTVNWMRALAILVDNVDFEDANQRAFYVHVLPRGPINSEADVFACERILLAMHNLAALRAFGGIEHKYDVVRSAIIAWYYCIYFSAQVMISVASGAAPETHAKTDKVWYSDIVKQRLVVRPFDLYLNSLISRDVDSEIMRIRGGNTYDLMNYPQNIEEALGCIYSYLNGTASYEREQMEHNIMQGKEFKKLGVKNFRTKGARQLRDAWLAKGEVNFLTQAFRYRGKANYRDSIYLSYGQDQSLRIEQFVSDLTSVGEKFLRMTCFYVKRRIAVNSWNEFVNDLNNNGRITIPLNLALI